MQNAQEQVTSLEEQKKVLIKEIEFFGKEHEKAKIAMEENVKRAKEIVDNKKESELEESLLAELKNKISKNSQKNIALIEETKTLEKEYEKRISELNDKFEIEKKSIKKYIETRRNSVDEAEKQVKGQEENIDSLIMQVENVSESLRLIKANL